VEFDLRDEIRQVQVGVAAREVVCAALACVAPLARFGLLVVDHAASSVGDFLDSTSS
jgi:hypothetical protein